MKEKDLPHLRYVHPADLTILRKGSGKSFRYVFANGRSVRSKQTLKRIASMVLPPAWKDVRICPSADGHLQAIGKDIKGRCQYRYHEKWTQHRNQTKFHRMIEFAKALPGMRRKIQADLSRKDFSREKVLAAAVDILQKTNIRVGNEVYTKENHSYGLSTLRNKHAEIRGQQIRFHFRAKSGKMREITFSDPKLSRVLKRCQELPGQHLFEYLDDDGKVHSISSSDINRYIQEISGNHFTAKDFRTWCGTTFALQNLIELGEAQLKMKDYGAGAILVSFVAQPNISATLHRFAKSTTFTRTFFTPTGLIARSFRRSRKRKLG